MKQVAPFVDCGDSQESVLHILRDCPVATGVWLNLVPSSRLYQFFGMELTEWVLANLRNKFTLNSGTVDWGVIFAVACWFLWKNRNKTIFQQSTSHSEEVLRRAECFAFSPCNAIKMEGTSTTNRSFQVKWRPPCHGWIKINTDGVANVNGIWSAIGECYGIPMLTGLQVIEDLLEEVLCLRLNYGQYFMAYK
ncbi:hypothetical protein J1N35_009498 [Gossypium stocksii]|uniref:RNase H type-1 domain-containing protein n=1 Tax=Gossypium stocksii TaxID=47602 RepID=A0A9D3W0M1_9ROSI|nr:hypothetical protein J1N35_009498 [Gossypium stocksii]